MVEDQVTSKGHEPLPDMTLTEIYLRRIADALSTIALNDSTRIATLAEINDKLGAIIRLNT